MKKILKILKYVKPYSGGVAANMLFNIGSIVFSLFSFILFIPFLELLFRKNQPEVLEPKTSFALSNSKAYLSEQFNYLFSKLIVEEGKLAALLYVCFMIICVFLFKNIFRYFALYFLVNVRYSAIRDIRNKLYRKVVSLPLGYHTEKSKGDIIARMTTDIQEIDASIMNTIEALMKEPITILVYIIGMIYISPQLTIFIFVLLPIAGLVIGGIGKSLRKVSMKGQNKLGDLFTIIHETLGGIRIVKAFNAEQFLGRRFETENQEYFRLNKKIARKRDLSSPLSEFLAVSVVVTVLWFGGKLILEGGSNLQPETFLVYIGIFSQIINPVKAFSSTYYYIQKGMASVERIEAILSEPSEIKHKKGKIFEKLKDKIEFKNVSFKYEEKEVLQNINITINRGETVALVGPSGGGKTTLLDVLATFYQVNKGKIEIDGIPIEEYDYEAFRKKIGVVSQEPTLFNDTINNNISFGNEKVNQEKIKQAAKAANAHEFIQNMEHQYDAWVGENGTKLSGGQRQRITIARALYSDPEILMLDEATSALDAESEQLVQEAIDHLTKDRTSIVIAHRLSTIQKADKIYVIDKGKVAQEGTHTELIKQGGIYKKLVDLQTL